MANERIRNSIYYQKSTAAQIEELYREDNCTTRSEFIEKAILYYIGYLKAEKNTDYLSPTITSSMRAVSNEHFTRLSRILFKLAVEVAVMNNLVAAMIQFDSERYAVLRRECEREVRRTNGDFGMDEALRWQRKVTADGETSG